MVSIMDSEPRRLEDVLKRLASPVYLESLKYHHDGVERLRASADRWYDLFDAADKAGKTEQAKQYEARAVQESKWADDRLRIFNSELNHLATARCLIEKLYPSLLGRLIVDHLPTILAADPLAEAQKCQAILGEVLERQTAEVSERTNGQDDDATLDARAAATKFAHPAWTDQQVADYIDCERTSLHKPNMVNFKLCKAALKAGRERYEGGIKNDRRRRPSNLNRPENGL